MKIIGQTKTLPVIEEVPVSRLFENQAEADHRMDPVIVEHLLDVFVNDRPCCSLTCSPTQLVQLVVGHLFTQGYIGGIDWIDSVMLTDDCGQAKVRLVEGVQLITPPKPLSVEDLQPVHGQEGGRLPCGTIDKVMKERIFAQAKALYDNADWFFQTGAAHSSSLAFDGEVRYRFADVSRHNTVDKLIGQVLMDGGDLHNGVLFTSGRIPLDMMHKIARAGIPVVCSRSAPTTAALAFAKELGITLIGFVRQGRMNVY